MPRFNLDMSPRRLQLLGKLENKLMKPDSGVRNTIELNHDRARSWHRDHDAAGGEIELFNKSVRVNAVYQGEGLLPLMSWELAGNGNVRFSTLITPDFLRPNEMAVYAASRYRCTRPGVIGATRDARPYQQHDSLFEMPLEVVTNIKPELIDVEEWYHDGHVYDVVEPNMHRLVTTRTTAEGHVYRFPEYGLAAYDKQVPDGRAAAVLHSFTSRREDVEFHRHRVVTHDALYVLGTINEHEDEMDYDGGILDDVEISGL